MPSLFENVSLDGIQSNELSLYEEKIKRMGTTGSNGASITPRSLIRAIIPLVGPKRVARVIR